MNSKFIKVSLVTSASVLLLIAGCGPQDMNDINDAQNSAQMDNKDDGGAPEGADMGQAPQGPQGMQGPQGPQDAQGMQGPQGPQEGGGCPAGGCPAGGGGGAGGCPSGQCEIPPDPDTNRAVRMPDQHSAEPTKIIPTNEKQLATDIIDYHTTTHIAQPTVRQHLVQKHRHLLERYFPKTVLHPSYRRVNRVVTSNSSSKQVMPTQVVVAPVVDYGCSEDVPQPQVVVTPIVRPVYASPCGFGCGGY